jgi:Transposase, Mutator family
MIYADANLEIQAKLKTFICKWRLKCPALAASLEEAGGKLFTFACFPKSLWKSIRTSNAIERLHEEFKRRIKTQTVLPSAETEGMLFWALLASGQIKCARWTAGEALMKGHPIRRLTSPHDKVISSRRDRAKINSNTNSLRRPEAPRNDVTSSGSGTAGRQLSATVERVQHDSRFPRDDVGKLSPEWKRAAYRLRPGSG